MEDKWAHAVKAPIKNWVGDYVHENGNYENKCMFCHDKFYGHKRRVVCHLCNNLTKDQIAYIVGLEIWRDTAHSERELNKTLGERIAKLLKRNEELEKLLKSVQVLDLVDQLQQERKETIQVLSDTLRYGYRSDNIAKLYDKLFTANNNES